MYDYCPKCGVDHLCPIDDGARYGCPKCMRVFLIIDELQFRFTVDQAPNLYDGLVEQLCNDNAWTETAETVKAVKP